MIDAALRIATHFAPNLVRRLAGDKAGEVAQRVLNIGQQVSGFEKPEEIEAALQDNAQLAHEFRIETARLDIPLEEAFLADRQDARDMRVQLAKMGQTDWMMYAVGLIVVIGLVVVVIAIFFVADLSAEQINLLNVLGGGLLAGFMSVVSFFFGSSRGSKEKTALLSVKNHTNAR